MIIGVTGKPGSGKDTIAKTLVEKYNFFQAELKTAIERTIHATFGIPMSIIRTRELREIPLREAGFYSESLDCRTWTVRKLMQWVGQTYREAFGQDIWPVTLWRDLNSVSDSEIKRYPHVVISDIRTQRDATYFKEMMDAFGGRFLLILVDRPGCGSTTAGGFKNHPLESHDLSNLADIIIHNEGTIDDLYAKVDDIVTAEGSTWLS